MRLYVESNFVLEIVLGQEQHLACEEILQLAEKGEIELVFPAYVFVETNATIIQRSKEWKDSSLSLNNNARELGRMASVKENVPQIKAAADIFVRAEAEARAKFALLRARLFERARAVAMDDEVLHAATKAEADLGMKLPDAVMLVSVYNDAKSRPAESLFLNRNFRDFDQDVAEQLREVGCKLIPSFNDGLALTRKMLAQPRAPSP